MKNLKKVVALVLAFAMVLSMGTVAFAAENAAEADTLYDLGLFKGYSATEKVLGLDDASDAYQAIVLIGRALGWAVDAEATTTFADVPEYAQAYVAFAVDAGITNGVSATEFGSTVDGKRMVTWTLRALGYGMNESWDDTDSLAATAGIELPTDAAVTRDTVVGVIYDTLTAKKVGSDTTVIDDLIAADASLQATAEAAGLVAAPSADFALVSAAPYGLKAIMITFTSDIDDDETIEVTDDGDDLVTNADQYVVDGNVLVVILDDVQDQVTELDLVITATGKDGIEVDEEETTITMADKKDPELVSVTVENAKTFVVKFSEPIDPASFEGPGVAVFDDVLLDDNKVVGELEQSDDLTELTYTLNDPVDANTYTFTMEDVEDFAGFVSPEEKVTVTVIADDAAPALVSVEATALDEVVLTFDEDVESIDSITIDGVDYDSSDWDIDGDEVTVTLDADLEAGDAFVAVKGDYDGVEDVIGNTSDDDIEFSFLAPFDDELPTVEVKVTEDNYIAVIFSETVTGFDIDSVDVEDSDEDAVAVTAVLTDETVSDDYEDEDNEDNIYLIQLTTMNLDETDYTVIIDGEDVKDESVLTNELADAEFEVTMFDIKDPTITDTLVIDTTANEEEMRIAFSEAMDEDTLAAIGNYILSGTPLKEFDDVEITVADDAKTVDILVPDTDLSAQTIQMFGLEDVAGNSLTSGVVAITDAAASFAGATFELTALDTIEVTSAGETFVVANADEFKLYDGADEVTSVYFKSAVVDEDDSEKLILTLSGDLKPDVTTANGTALTITVSGDDTVDSFDIPFIQAGAAIADGVSATMDVEEDQVDKIVLTFDEVIVFDDGDFNGDTVVRDEDGDAVALADGDFTAATVDGVTVVTIALAVAEDTDYTIEVISRNIADSDGNVVNAIPATDVTVKP